MLFPFWGAFETSHAYIVYERGLERRAYRLARVYDYIYEHVVDLTGYSPGKPVVYVISTGTSPNGFATPFVNRDVLFFSTPGLGMRKLLNFYWWDYLLASHELTHLSHLRNISGVPYFLGLLFTLNPYIFSPAMTDFLVESTTVYAESSFSPYQGRLNNPLATRGLMVPFVKRSIMLGGGFPSDFDIEMYPPNRYPGYGSIYLIPSQFYEFLIDKYGLDRVKRFHRLMGRNWKLFFGINGVYKKAFGEDRRTLWRRWQAYLYRKYANETIPGKELIPINGDIVTLFVYENRLYGVLSLFTDTESFSAEPSYYLVEFPSGKSASIGGSSFGRYRIIRGLAISYEDLPKFRGNELYFLSFDAVPGGLYPGASYPVRYKTVLWSYSLKTHKFRKIVSSPSPEKYISAFEKIPEENAFLISYFDEVSEKSHICVFNGKNLREVIAFDGKVISLERSQGGYFVVVQPPLSSQKIYFMKQSQAGTYRATLIDESPYFKYGFRGTGKGLLFTACTDGVHMDVYLMDSNSTLWKLTDGAYASVALLDDGSLSGSGGNLKLYYVGFSLRSYGRSLWEAKPLWERAQFESKAPDVPDFPSNTVKKVSWVPHRLNDVFVPKIVSPTGGYDPVEDEWGAGAALLSVDPLSLTSYSLIWLYMFKTGGLYLNFSAQNYLPWAPLRLYAGGTGMFYPFSDNISGEFYIGASCLLYHGYVPVQGGFSLALSPSAEFDYSFDNGGKWLSVGLTISKSDSYLSLPSAGWWDYHFRLASAFSLGSRGSVEATSGCLPDNLTLKGYVIRGFRGFIKGSAMLCTSGRWNVPEGIFNATYVFSSPVLLDVIDSGIASARFYLYSIYASPFFSFTLSRTGDTLSQVERAFSLDDWKIGAYLSFSFSWIVPRMVLFMSIGGYYGKSGPGVIFNLDSVPYMMGMFSKIKRLSK